MHAKGIPGNSLQQPYSTLLNLKNHHRVKRVTQSFYVPGALIVPLVVDEVRRAVAVPKPRLRGDMIIATKDNTHPHKPPKGVILLWYPSGTHFHASYRKKPHLCHLMKKIDIHTGDESEPGRYQKEIGSDEVYRYVLEQIDFQMPEAHWGVIDKAFAYRWNHIVGIGGYFYWDEFTDYVYQEVQKEKILIPKERIEQIVNHILTFIQNNGGFLT
jgi:hypothetical protein